MASRLGWLRHLLRRTSGVPEQDQGSALLAAFFFFCLLCSYYILRPVREEMGIAGGVRNLPYLYLATLAAMLGVVPLFGALVRRYRREVFVPVVYHVIAANLVVFYLLLQWLPPEAQVNLGRTFYVWVSVYNLFMMSLFWSFMADGLGLERSKRVFGFIAVGGTAGAWLGSTITGALVGIVGRPPLLLISVVFLEVAIVCAVVLARRFPRPDPGPERVPARGAAAGTAPSNRRPATLIPSPGEAPAVGPPQSGGGILGGIALTIRSPYLLAVAGYLCLYSLTSTFAYFEQASIVAGETLDRTARVTLFARIDFWVNLVTLITQLFFTGRLIRRLGTGWTLAALPLATAAGFLALGLAPTLTVLTIFQVVRRTSNYALAKPARETLFAILDRNGTYKAKNFLDTFVRRGGDAIGAGLYSVLTRLGVGLAGVAYLAIPLALLWGGLALYLGREQGRRAGTDPASPSERGTIAAPTV